MKTIAFNRPSKFWNNSILNPNTFENFFESLNKESASFVPAVNISTKNDNYLLDFSVPGFNKEDFKIELTNEVLTISGEHKTEVNNEEQNFSRKEYTIGSFKRSFALPENADFEKIEAKYENGILNVFIPKKEAVNTSNTKEIKIA